MFKEETLQEVESRTYEEPDGEFLEIISNGSNTITVLTKVDSEKGGEQKVNTPDPSEMTVSELNDALSRRDGWKDSTLRALLEAEQDGKDRTTAVNAIKEKLE